MWLFLCKTFSCINCCRKICRGYFWIVSYTLFCVNSCIKIFHFLPQRIFLQEFLYGFLQVFVQVFMCKNLCTFSGRKSFSSTDIPAGFSARISAGFRTRKNRAAFLANFSAFFVQKFMHIFCINALRVLFSFF